MSKIGSFITGAAVGVLAALLFAPQSGEKTRALVVEKANAFAGEAKDFGTSIPNVAQDVVKSAQQTGQGFISDAQTRVKGATGQPAEVDSDELREKIEAARKRIAAQVMENAEQSKAVDIAAQAQEQVAEAAEKIEEQATEAAEIIEEQATEAAEEMKDVVENAKHAAGVEENA